MTDVIKVNFGTLETYCEPFAGGAGAATLMLGAGVIEKVHLNDADPRVYYAWNSLLHETEEFLERLETAPLTMTEWWRQKEIVDNLRAHTTFEVGFAAFYLNRTNRSGILQKAGPIGGYAQEGKWGIDARFNRHGLSARIKFLSENREKIEITNLDAITLLKDGRVSRSFLFIDPPYVQAGSRLYFNSMDDEKHRELAEYLLSSDHKWIMTYDDADLVKTLYEGYIVDRIPIRYTLQNKRLEQELLIQSPGIRLPEAVH